MVLALAVMVKNEAHIVERLVNSCLGKIDLVIVSDTGSTDNTLQVFQDVCNRNNLPLFIEQVEWKDFGTNRTSLMKFAENKADWLLLGDADLTFEFSDDFSLENLEGDAFLIPFNGPEFYRKVLLVRNNRDWQYKCRTHEYIDSEKVNIHFPLDTITATHYGDGGSRFDKFERDAKLLMQDFDDSQMAADRPRIAFYLGQTYECMSQWSDAYSWYRMRAELGGWEEERWVAEYRAAKIVNDIDGCMQAWGKRPQRLEALYTTSILSMKNEDWVWSEMFLRHGLFLTAAKRAPGEDILFVDKWIYDFGLKVLLTIALFKLGQDFEAKHGVASLVQQDESFKFLLNSMTHFKVDQRWIEFAHDARSQHLKKTDTSKEENLLQSANNAQKIDAPSDDL